MSTSIPIIRLEVERMKQTIVTALTTQALQLDKDIQNAVEKYCTERNIADLIQRETERVLDEVIKEVEQHLAYLDAEIKRTEKLIREHIDKHPQFKVQRDLLVSIPGIGEATAALFLAEVDVEHYSSARQVAAFAGLVPKERQSGSSVRGRTRLSKVGTSRLRKAFYFPAVTALRCNSLVRRWAEGLRERGKCKMAVIGAAMRKLVHLAYGVLKTRRPFDPQWAKSA